MDREMFETMPIGTVFCGYDGSEFEALEHQGQHLVCHILTAGTSALRGLEGGTYSMMLSTFVKLNPKYKRRKLERNRV